MRLDQSRRRSKLTADTLAIRRDSSTESHRAREGKISRELSLFDISVDLLDKAFVAFTCSGGHSMEVRYASLLASALGIETYMCN